MAMVMDWTYGEQVAKGSSCDNIDDRQVGRVFGHEDEGDLLLAAA